MDYNTSDLLTKIVDGEHNSAKEVFNQLMNDKILSEIGAKKIEIAKTMLPNPEISQSEIVMNKVKEME